MSFIVTEFKINRIYRFLAVNSDIHVGCALVARACKGHWLFADTSMNFSYISDCNGIRKYLRVTFFAGTFFTSCSSRGSFFACNILVFKLIYEGSEGVSTCIYFYLLLKVYLLYLLITRRTTPGRIFREECSGKEHDAKKFPRHNCNTVEQTNIG